ncbi:MAG: diguanylate cyclase [Gemmatimonadota bacterium]
MPPQISSPVVVLLAGSVFYCVMAWVLLRYRRAHGAGVTAFAMGACLVWVAGALLSGLAPTLPLQLLSLNVAYLGACFTPLAILVFVAFYTRSRPIPRRLILLLAVLPLVSAFLIWTNPWHELMWAHPPLDADGRFTIRAQWGPWFKLVHAPYHWTLVIVATVFLGRAALLGSKVVADAGPRIGRLHAAVLLVALVGTFSINVITVLGTRDYAVSPTAVAIAFSSVLFLWVFAQLELVPFRHVAHRRILATMPDAVFVTDERDVILDLNPAAAAFATEAGGAGPGMRLGAVLAEERALLEVLDLPGDVMEEVSTRCGRRYEIRVSTVVDASGSRRGRTVMLRDITERRRQEATLRSIVDVSPNGILRAQPVRNHTGEIHDFVCTFANPAAVAALDLSPEIVEGGRALELLPVVGPQVVPVLRSALERDQQRVLELPVREDEADDPLWYRLFVSPVGGDVIITFVDITAEKRRQEEMEEVAFRDPLTRLLNRRGLEQAFEDVPLPPRRGRGGHVLLYMDLDRFKPVNDTYGHPAGDRLLKEFAARLRSATRDGDLLARIGGDEFVVLLLDVDAESADSLIERLTEVTAAPYWLSGSALSCRPSIGIAHLTERTSTLADALVAADRAMYLAKASGGGRKTAAPALMETV